jgi:hypothetical protein
MVPLEVPDALYDGVPASEVAASVPAKDATAGGRIDVEAVSSCFEHLPFFSSASTGSASSVAEPASGDDASPPATASANILAKRWAHLAPNTALFFPEEPLHVVRGSGAELFDAEGHSYLDCEPIDDLPLLPSP